MFNEIYEVVKKIPMGKVMNYGTVAALAGFPGCSRQVGFALHQNPDEKNIPCHRVVFKNGALSPVFRFGGENIQRKMLEDEGVVFVNGKVDMRKHALSEDG